MVDWLPLGGLIDLDSVFVSVPLDRIDALAGTDEIPTTNTALATATVIFLNRGLIA
jgi:hypothetical protein